MVEEKRVAFETARLELARLNTSHVEAGFVSAARIAAQALRVARVGIWLIDGERGALVCQCLYQAASDTVLAGDMLFGEEFPRYWHALHTQRSIAVENAFVDERTSELTDAYLRPLNVSSMLDAAIYRDGQVIGVVCHEHVGVARKWTQADIDFSATVADLAGSVLEHANRLALEQELRQRIAVARDLERFDVVRRISGAVAHDFRNVFTALGLIGKKLESASPELGKTLQSSLSLGQFLTAQLESFAHRPATSVARAEVASVITQLRPMLELLVRGSASLVFEGGTALVAAIPPGALEQVLLNLVLNARDAIVDHGEIAVSLTSTDQLVQITVRDNGRGIAPEHLARVFDLGFSTRPSSSGIGLSTVRDTLQCYRGTITVTSTLGQGSVFEVRVPRIVE